MYWFRASATFEVAPTRAATARRRAGETRARAAKSASSARKVSSTRQATDERELIHIPILMSWKMFRRG
jgi:hypothetical protein